jgi:putative copper export protein
VPPSMTLNPELLHLALGLNRILTYTGYVLLAGTFAFWSLVWPEGRTDRRLVSLAAIGAGLMVVGTVGAPMIWVSCGHPLGDALSPVGGTGAIIRLAILVGIAFFFVDLIRSPVTGGRRSAALGIVAVLAATLVVQSNAVVGPWQSAKIVATAGHLLAVAAWLGGLVALAAVLIPRKNLQELDVLIPRFSTVAVFSVVTLVITGAIHALAVAGSVGALLNSRYGQVLLFKLVFFGVMLLLGNEGRKYASRAVFERKHLPESERGKSTTRADSLALVVGVELTIAFVILSTTSILVMVAPQP